MEFNQYVSIPWECGKRSHESADCWGLVLLVLEEQFGVTVSHMRDIAIANDDDVAAVMQDSRALDDWPKVTDPQAGDVCMMFVKRGTTSRPEHVGIVTDSKHVLHSFTKEAGVSAIHRIRVLDRIFHRLEFFRYAASNSI